MRAADAIEKLQTMDPEEPVFVLRGQDMLAPQAVEAWCLLFEEHDLSPSAKVREARECAEDMGAWEPRKLPD